MSHRREVGIDDLHRQIWIVGSPPIFTSAVATLPHAVDEPKNTHSLTTSGPDFCAGSATVSACEKILSPYDPVSISRPSMVWHLVVPGVQTVT